MVSLQGLLTALVVGLLAGCAGQKPLDYHPANELSESPGLFSGEDGAFVIPLGERKSPPGDESPDAAQEDSTAYQEWRRKSEGSEEYREFQEWLEWKEWRRQQAK